MKSLISAGWYLFPLASGSFQSQPQKSSVELPDFWKQELRACARSHGPESIIEVVWLIFLSEQRTPT